MQEVKIVESCQSIVVWKRKTALLIESLLSSMESIVWRTCDRNKKEHRHDSSPSRRGSNNPRMASVHYKEFIQEGEDKGIVY